MGDTSHVARDPNTPDGAPPMASVGGGANAGDADARRPEPPAQRLRAFLELAAIEARRYGDDDDVFVRELVQNARDAGAKVISFRTEVDGVDDDDVSTFNALAGEEQAIVGGREHLIVDDDGEGMSRDQVSRQLLRLFSSEKAERPSTAGCFGVGFWSVLRAGPEEILVDTHDGKAGCAFVIDIVNARLRELPSRRAGHGTTICLSRPGGSRTFAWRSAILHEAASVTGRNGPPPELRLITRISRANGDGNAAHEDAHLGDDSSDDEAADANTETNERTEILNRPLDLAGLEGVVASTPVRGPGFRGLVGLSTRPRVELFHHGLRVVEASSLQALLPSRRHMPREGLGLAIRVDVDNLTVLLDRRSVVEDDQLKAVVLACERAATQLEHDILDNAAPLPPWRAGVARLKEVFGPRPVRVAAACVLAFAVGGGGAVAGLHLVAGQPHDTDEAC